MSILTQPKILRGKALTETLERIIFETIKPGFAAARATMP